MTTPVASREAPWRAKAQSAIFLAVGLIGIVAGVFFVYVQIQYRDEQSAFQAAAACSTPETAATSQRCTFTGPATIKATHRSIRIFVDVTFAALPDRTFTTSFATNREPTSEMVRVGVTQTAQLWDGKVTKFAGVGTVDDPEYLVSSVPEALAFVVAGLVVAIWSSFLVRRAWRR